MIPVDGPPESWAGRVAQLMADRGRPAERITGFLRVVFGHPVRGVNRPGHPGESER